MAEKKKRAPRVPAPGAKRVAVLGQMAVPDDFGRLRLLLLEPAAARALAAAVGPSAGRLPYAPRADGTGVVAEAWLTPPPHRRAFWLAEAARLRGARVRAEATVRPYSAPALGAGLALDLWDLKAVDT